jgi:hypothetical protein
MDAVYIPIIAIISGTIMVVLLRRYQNIERISLIERGVNPGDIKAQWFKNDPHRHLRHALTGIGLGLGFLIHSLFFDNGDGKLLAGFILVFGGLGLFGGYMMQLKLQSKARSEDQNHNE